MNHTPGPWKANLLNADGLVIRKAGWEISTPKYDVCANIQAGAPIRKEADAYLIAAAPDQNETLRADAAFLRNYLENYTVSVQVRDERGYVTNSFAAVQIPDWAVKQRLEDIDAAIAKAEGKG